MSIYIDADAFAQWEKGQFDLLSWIEQNAADIPLAFPATVWQQLVFGVFDWQPERAAKRLRFLFLLGAFPVIPFSRNHAVCAARLAAQLKLKTIGFAVSKSRRRPWRMALNC